MLRFWNIIRGKALNLTATTLNFRAFSAPVFTCSNAKKRKREFVFDVYVFMAVFLGGVGRLLRLQ